MTSQSQQEQRYVRIITFLLKWLYARGLVLYAALSGKSFYCNVLTGDSTINTVINSDLSVSCTCLDKDGTGKIGDLHAQGLAEIFSGERANSFRKALAQGRLPIHCCAGCIERRWIKKGSADAYLRNYHLPVAITVENTAECNMSCLYCHRDQIYKNRRKRSMSLDEMRLVSRAICENHIKYIAYVNFGEPFISQTIKQELEIIKNENPEVSMMTSTNGTMLDSQEKMEAALYFDHIYFSIDGSTQESLHRYQHNGDFDAAYRNMKALVGLRNTRNKKRPVIEWKYVLFRWNDSHRLISRAIELARAAKVDRLSFWPTVVPIDGISYRYYLGLSRARRVGTPSKKNIYYDNWMGREIDFREVG